MVGCQSLTSLAFTVEATNGLLCVTQARGVVPDVRTWMWPVCSVGASEGRFLSVLVPTNCQMSVSVSPATLPACRGPFGQHLAVQSIVDNRWTW